jgi:hypothetical protein
MVEVAGIRDRETLEAWLQGRSREDAICIVHRAALRVAPLLWNDIQSSWVLKRGLTDLSNMWPIVVSGVACKKLSPTVGAAARQAILVAVANFANVNAQEASERVAFAPNGAAANADLSYAARSVDVAFAAAIAVADTNSTFGAAAAATDRAAIVATDKSWLGVRMDCAALEAGGDPFALPLWDGPAPESIADAWARTREEWAKAGGPVWAFWTQFYENALLGRPQDWPLLHDIALIPAEDWQGGPDRVHPIIEGMLKRRADQEIGKGEVAQDLASLPAAPRSTIQQVQAALSLNRVALPPTFEAVEGFIALEIARLQSRNHQSDDEAEEARRMIRTLSFLAEAVLQMRAAVPADGPAGEGQATHVEGLARLYMKKLGELPRIKADEVVEGIWSAGKGVCQIGLIGCSATLMVAFGLPALASVAAATLVIAPKLGSEAIKGAIELAKSQAKP